MLLCVTPAFADSDLPITAFVVADTDFFHWLETDEYAESHPSNFGDRGGFGGRGEFANNFGTRGGFGGSDAYQDYVDSLPAPIIGNTGIIQGAPISYFFGCPFYDFENLPGSTAVTDRGYVASPMFQARATGSYDYFDENIESDESNGSFVIHTSYPNGYFGSASPFWFGFEFYPLSSGAYNYTFEGTFIYSVVLYRAGQEPLSHTYSYDFNNAGQYTNSIVWYKGTSDIFNLCTGYTAIISVLSTPDFVCSPYSDYETIHANIYNTNTRTGVIVGDYGIIGDNNNLTVLQNIQVVNESNNTFYNFQTNEYQSFESWNYDYSDRSYDLTLSDGSVVNIVFADGKLEFSLGGVTLDVNYVAEKETANYTVNHYRVSSEGAVTLEQTETLSGDVGATVTASPVSMFGARYDASRSTASGTVLADGSLVLSLYYNNAGIDSPDPTDSPQPSDSPQPTAPPGNCEDCYDGPDLNWWEQFKLWLGDKLDGLGGDTNVTVEVPQTVEYQDEEGESRTFDLSELIQKLKWFLTLKEIGEEFFAQISANEQAAYQYSAEVRQVKAYNAELMASGADEAQLLSVSNPPGAPSIKINLGAAQSYYGFRYGGEMEMLDLSWYTPYKQTVDNLVGGFLWLVFLWGVFKNAPNIVAGAGITSNRLDAIESGTKGKRGK